MIYFKFISPFGKMESGNIHKSKFIDVICKALRAVLPKANPDFDDKYESVRTWYIEYDENNNWVNREIGLDSINNVIVKAPYLKNIGFWMDEDLKIDDYLKFNIEYITTDRFEELWRKEVII